MTRPRPQSSPYLELALVDPDDPDDETPTDVRVDEVMIESATRADDWLDGATVRFDFDRPLLTAEERLVVGYLTLEEHGMFAGLSLEEQQAIAATLRR